MMHSNSFVLAVRDQNRQVLREIGGRVYIPFHSEYGLLLKNNNSVRAVCSVSIDGTDVLGGNELIVEAHGSVDLERFVADGDLHGGRRFKFVPLSDSDVQDPSASENGVIEARFWRELQPITPPPTLGVLRNRELSKGVGGSSVYYCADFAAEPCAASFASDMRGATVAGSYSSQQFAHGYFRGKDGGPVVLRLQLYGRKEPLTVHNTQHQHCSFCGKKVPWGNQFCGQCGARMPVLI